MQIQQNCSLCSKTETKFQTYDNKILVKIRMWSKKDIRQLEQKLKEFSVIPWSLLWAKLAMYDLTDLSLKTVTVTLIYVLVMN